MIRSIDTIFPERFISQASQLYGSPQSSTKAPGFGGQSGVFYGIGGAARLAFMDF
jgi:hypothetical protein